MIIRALQAFGLRPSPASSPLTTNWKIFRAILFVGAGSMLAKLATIFKEVVVASYFGRSDSIDAFLIALVLPLAFTGLIAGSFNAALVPVYIRIQETDGPEAAQKLLSSVQVVNLVLLGTIVVLMAAAAPFYLPFLGSGFEPGKLWVTRKLLYLLLPIIILNGVAGVWSSALNAHERFTLPALTPAATPLLIVLGLYVLAKRWGIFVLAGGTVAGAIAEAYLMAQAARQCGISLQVRWFGLTPDVRAVIRQYVPTFAGTLVLSISPIIDQSMAAMLKPGSVAALSYGYKIVIGIVALTSVGLSTAVLPYFAQMVAKRDWRECRHTVRIYSLLVLAVTVPIAIGLMLWSGQVVRALFQRGAFTETDTVLVSAIQIRFALIIPLASWTILFVRLLSALERSDVLVHSAVLSAFLNIVFNVVFMRKWGVAGIALSTTVVCAVICVFMGIRALHLLDRQEAQGAASWKTQDAGQ